MEAAKWTLTERTHTGTAKLTEAPIKDSEKYVEYGMCAGAFYFDTEKDMK